MSNEDPQPPPLLSFEDFRIEEVSELWHGMDLDTMGRVLRAHLVVEHFMGELLKAEGHRLTQLRDAGLRLTFMHKLNLLYPGRGPLWDCVNQLNQIRNHFAHRPDHRLNDAEARKLKDFAGAHFANYFGEYVVARGIDSPGPINTVEACAEWLAFLMQAGARALEKLATKIAEHETAMIGTEAKLALLAEMRADDAEIDDGEGSGGG
jgi:hypothetical protein